MEPCAIGQNRSYMATQKVVYVKLPKQAKTVPVRAFTPSNAPGTAAPATPPVSVTDSYAKGADPLIAAQIEKAGMRLASILNSTGT